MQGTKLACGEGGCGSCAVEVKRYEPRTGVHNIAACTWPCSSQPIVLYLSVSTGNVHTTQLMVLEGQPGALLLQSDMPCQCVDLILCAHVCQQLFTPGLPLNACHLAGRIQTRSINSCLAPIGTLDGVQVITVEGLGNSKKGFHPVQGDALTHVVLPHLSPPPPATLECPSAHQR